MLRTLADADLLAQALRAVPARGRRPVDHTPASPPHCTGIARGSATHRPRCIRNTAGLSEEPTSLCKLRLSASTLGTAASKPSSRPHRRAEVFHIRVSLRLALNRRSPRRFSGSSRPSLAHTSGFPAATPSERRSGTSWIDDSVRKCHPCDQSLDVKKSRVPDLKSGPISNQRERPDGQEVN